MLPLENEYTLIALLNEGDKNAFDSIYRHYFSAVYGNALKLTRQPLLAEDIVQEVFISLWEDRTSIKSSGSLAGWIFVNSYNRSVNKLKQQLRESLLGKVLSEQGEAGAEDTNEIFEQQWQMVEEAMAGLSPQKRKVFQLCKLQGKTYEETAGILKISKHTVKEYLSAALAQIKEQVLQYSRLPLLILILIFH